MPPRRSNKKKVKSRDRNIKATCCQGCSKQLDKDNFVYCVCTQVRFCSSSCQDDYPHHGCTGPPETEFSVTSMLQNLPEEERVSRDARNDRDAENRETVQKPLMAYILSKGLQGINSRFSVWDLAKWADEGDGPGNQACAFIAGSRFRHRLLGETRLDGAVSNTGGDDIPVLESQELAFKYFERAAKLGHGIAMQSLGTCFDDGVGVKSNRRRCNQWLWKSVLHGSAGAIELLDCRALLPLEIRANEGTLQQAMQMMQPGQTMQLGGPNLGALLLVFHDVLRRENFSLPPFAGNWATGTVNNPVQRMRGHSRTPLIGGKDAKELLLKIQYLEMQLGLNFTFGYLRRGAAKQATAQTRGADPRAKDNQIFFAPPFASCDETVTDDMINKWHDQSMRLAYSQSDSSRCAYFTICVHNEGSQDKGGFCRACEADAIERLDAIARGQVVLSLDEDLPHRGQAAIFRDKNGALKIETWKTYAGGEAECVLATLAASGMPSYVSPLFIAQDPNYLWPLIADHGSIRAAVEFVAPHVDWNDKIGAAKENEQEQDPIIPGCRPGKHLRKCGNGFCNNLEHYRSETFQYCSRCNRRKYCSTECQRDDWPIHKLECSITNSETVANPRLDDAGEGNAEDKPLKYDLKLDQGEDCVVHGLKGKPQYNGKVGVIGESMEGGRVAVTLRYDEGNVISIKPDNLYCIGVFCRKRKKKSRVFECKHGLVCCADCYLDFTTINRLAKLKYDGQNMTSAAAIEQCEEIYFSSLSLEPGESSFSLDEGWPMECVGMKEHPEQRYILRALVKVESPMSLHATVARTAFVTYGGAFTDLVLRGCTKLGDVAQML
eukprot:scaffold10709_cov130-Skeletonema_marinoi.AAC.5